MFYFTPLIGAQSLCSASQSLLEFDGGIKILINVGWGKTFSVEQLRELEKHAPTLSFILLTHATRDHLGAYAYCCKNIPLFTRIPVYAAAPVISLGRTLLQDIYQSCALASSIIPQSRLNDLTYSIGGVGNQAHNPNLLLFPPTPDEIADYFSQIYPLKFSQPHQPQSSPLSPSLNGLTITAYSAGYTLGGTIWHFQYRLESVIYAVDWNLAREHVVSCAAWLGGAIGSGGGSEIIEQLRKPTALICSARGAERVSMTGGRKARDELLLQHIRNTFKQGGCVLIPCDSSARVLELAFVLERGWKISATNPGSEDEGLFSLNTAKLYFASKTGGSTMRYARSMLEWMDESMVREFETVNLAGTGNGSGNTSNRDRADKHATGQRGGTGSSGVGGGGNTGVGAGHFRRAIAAPFDFQFLQMIESEKQIHRALSKPGPKLFLASDASLDWGFSRLIMERLAHDVNNLIILTERHSITNSVEQGLSMEEKLWNMYATRTNITEKFDAGSRTIDVVRVNDEAISTIKPKIERLNEEETCLYQHFLAHQKQLLNTVRVPDNSVSLENVADVGDDRSSTGSESSDNSDTQYQGKAINVSATLNNSRSKVGLSDAEMGITKLLRGKDVHDYDVRGKKGREKMFPYVVRRKRCDEFGDVIRTEDFLRADEMNDRTFLQDLLPSSISPSSHPINTFSLQNVEGASVGQKRKWNDHLPGTCATGNEEPGIATFNGYDKLGYDAKRKKLGYDDVMRGGRCGGGGSARWQDHGDEDMCIGGGAGNSDSESDSVIDDNLDDLIGSSDIFPDQNGPRKVIFVEENRSFSFSLAYVDFSGIHDKRSLLMVIPLIRPGKLILVGGTPTETRALAEDCGKLLGPLAGNSIQSITDIFTPDNSSQVNASVNTNAWMVKLSPNLLKRLKWQKVRGLGVVAVSAQLLPPPCSPVSPSACGPVAPDVSDITNDSDSCRSTTALVSTNSTNSSHVPFSDSPPTSDNLPVPILDVLPANLASASRSVAAPLHVGDLRLANLRKLLQASGYNAEFRGEGTLLVDNTVAVRKNGPGKIEVECNLDATTWLTQLNSADKSSSTNNSLKYRPASFYDVRGKVYEGLAIVAGASSMATGPPLPGS